jgi:hypothetical protein
MIFCNDKHMSTDVLKPRCPSQQLLKMTVAEFWAMYIYAFHAQNACFSFTIYAENRYLLNHAVWHEQFSPAFEKYATSVLY